ncbi:alpha/beta hydrolase [Rhodanobacter koreensis]
MALSLTTATVSQAAATAQPERTPDSYARAGNLVSIGGNRQLNLRCSGHGSQTVLLEAGAHADSVTWFRLQPLLAPLVRVCSYDRAGYGFSDEGPLPRGLDADVADLHALIHAAGISTPVILVGHSLGSNIVRRYAELNPADVSGMVLLDPPAQHIAAFSPAWVKADDDLATRRFAFLAQCLKGAVDGTLATPPPALEHCLGGPTSWASPAVNAAMRNYKLRPVYWRTLISELQENVSVFRQPVSPKESHGSLPLIVLKAANTYADMPANDSDRKMLEAARDKTQEAIVATSKRGELRLVPSSSHDIQLDQPQVVADAVTQVMREASQD